MKTKTKTIVALAQLGLDGHEIDVLIRASRTLHRWDERCCGDSRSRTPIRDLETLALKQCDAIMKKHHGLRYYHQSDCRGVALYILRARDVKGQQIDEVYARGVAV